MSMLIRAMQIIYSCLSLSLELLSDITNEENEKQFAGLI